MACRIGFQKRASRCSSELHSDSKTVRYELEMLLGTAIEYEAAIGGKSAVFQNACVESFAIHCRALILFFFGHMDQIQAGGKTERFSKKVYANDVFAADFCSQWPDVCPSPTVVLVESKSRADKHIAHITVDRREVNQRGSDVKSVWPIGEAADDLVMLMGSFLKSVQANSLDSSELLRMERLVRSWRLKSEELSLKPLSGGSSGINSRLFGKTDASTNSTHPGFSMNGCTE